MIATCSFLVRGLLAGLLAGFVAFGVAYAVGEPPIDAAIALEESAAHTSMRTRRHRPRRKPAPRYPGRSSPPSAC